jgi:5-methylcytosine-specific restriction endonuclease McrA
MNPIIKPANTERVYDAVSNAGVDVTQWHRTSAGAPVKNPAANPHYCYRWAFFEPASCAALCIWWEDVASDALGAYYESNSRGEAMGLESAVEDWRHTDTERKQAKRWAGSAREFDAVVKQAYWGKLPVKCILVARDSSAVPGRFERSEARYRELDTTPWHVETYEMETGRYVIRRGPLLATNPIDVDGEMQPPSSGAADGHILTESISAVVELAAQDEGDTQDEPAADQFTNSDRPIQYERNGLVYERLKWVRDIALKRAGGRCELSSCQAYGFRKGDGSVYLETHHVIPLSAGGLDSPTNVIALCPNHHREAHYGELRDEMLAQFQSLLQVVPASRAPTLNGEA